MYVRSLVSQAALAHGETQAGEDHMSFDMNVDFRSAAVRVQVKCGASKPLNKDQTYSVYTEQKWRDDWATAKIPVYLVYVHLAKRAPRNWIEHPAKSTTMHAHAYWLRVNSVSAATVRIPIANRLSLATFADWEHDLDLCFS